MNRMMVDIETLGTSTRSVVLHIAFVVFNKANGVIATAEYFPDPSKQKGRTIDFATVKWWMTVPDEEVRRTIFARESFHSIPDIMKGVCDMWHDHGAEELWAKGPHFDVAILQDWLYGWPWNFREVCDMRTLKKVRPSIAPVVSSMPHHALSDAIAQAEWVRAALED